MKHDKLQTIGLRNLPSLCEKWVQEIISADPLGIATKATIISCLISLGGRFANQGVCGQQVQADHVDRRLEEFAEQAERSASNKVLEFTGRLLAFSYTDEANSISLAHQEEAPFKATISLEHPMRLNVEFDQIVKLSTTIGSGSPPKLSVYPYRVVYDGEKCTESILLASSKFGRWETTIRKDPSASTLKTLRVRLGFDFVPKLLDVYCGAPRMIHFCDAVKAGKLRIATSSDNGGGLIASCDASSGMVSRIQFSESKSIHHVSHEIIRGNYIEEIRTIRKSKDGTLPGEFVYRIKDDGIETVARTKIDSQILRDARDSDFEVVPPEGTIVRDTR